MADIIAWVKAYHWLIILVLSGLTLTWSLLRILRLGRAARRETVRPLAAPDDWETKAKKLHEEMVQAGVKHLFILEKGDTFRLGGHGDPKWTQAAMLLAADKLPAIMLEAALNKAEGKGKQS